MKRPSSTIPTPAPRLLSDLNEVRVEIDGVVLDPLLAQMIVALVVARQVLEGVTMFVETPEGRRVVRAKDFDPASIGHQLSTLMSVNPIQTAAQVSAHRASLARRAARERLAAGR